MLTGNTEVVCECGWQMFPCERVNETSDILCIGSIQEGFNIKNAKICSMLQKFQKMSVKGVGVIRCVSYAVEKQKIMES